MRAKLKVTHVDVHPEEGTVGTETVHFQAVGKTELYDSSGSDEDNTYAKFTPSADLKIHIANPDLIGAHKPGDVFYVDFTRVES